MLSQPRGAESIGGEDDDGVGDDVGDVFIPTLRGRGGEDGEAIKVRVNI